MRILLLDIETRPTLAWVWALWKQNVGTNQIAEDGSILCWAAKWLDEDKVLFDSVKKSNERNMLGRMHRLISQADAVIHYNGKRFDMPTLNREWLKHGFLPPPPPKQIDLYQVCKKQFRFVSNKFDYVAKFLDLDGKAGHAGFETWQGCMNGDAESWRVMEAYNKQDVTEMELLYHKLRPWIDNHPSHGAKDMISCCPNCGSEDMQQRGFAMTKVHKYRRYQCKGCGTWSRGNKTVLPKLAAGEERFVNVTR